MIRYMAIFVLCSASFLRAESITQSDWSSGPGVPGPVLDWADTFYENSGVSWRSVEGTVSLSSSPLSTSVESVIEADFPCSSLDYGDLDQDGDIDLIATSVVEEHLLILENGGSDGWSTVYPGGSFEGALWVDVCDLDNDGDDDLLEVTQTPDQVIAWINADGSGSNWDMYIIDSSFSLGHSVFGTDMDNDGDVDITAASSGGSEVAVWYNNGGSPDSWPKDYVSSYAPGVRTAVPANLDSDAEMEIVGALFDSNRMVWWDKTPTGWDEYSLDESSPGVHHAFCSDLDHDGDIDVLGASFFSGTISWWRNDGGTPISWFRTDITNALTGALIAWGGDMDGDGDIDVASTGWNSDRIVWFENLSGTGSSWQNHIVAQGFNGAWPVIPADIDGDGCVELVAGADVLSGPGISHGISSFEVCEFNSTGSLTSSILDTGCDPQWASTEWDLDIPPGTDFSVSWKTSDNPASMGDWSNTIHEPGLLSGYLERYVQYRLEFSTSDPSVSPVFRDISLNWDPTGIEYEGDDELSIRSINGVPCSTSAVSIGVNFPEGVMNATVSMFDLSGRLVSAGFVTAVDPVFEAGELRSGVYHATVDTGVEYASIKVVALN